MGKREIINFPELTDITDGSTIRDMGLPALFSFFLILKTGRDRQTDRQSLEVQRWKWMEQNEAPLFVLGTAGILRCLLHFDQFRMTFLSSK
jgi:hypothetical protein